MNDSSENNPDLLGKAKFLFIGLEHKKASTQIRGLIQVARPGRIT
jgi:hypothetical protein